MRIINHRGSAGLLIMEVYPVLVLHFFFGQLRLSNLRVLLIPCLHYLYTYMCVCVHVLKVNTLKKMDLEVRNQNETHPIQIYVYVEVALYLQSTSILQ